MRWGKALPVAANDNEPLLPHPVSFGWRGFFVSTFRASLPSRAAAPRPRAKRARRPKGGIPRRGIYQTNSSEADFIRE